MTATNAERRADWSSVQAVASQLWRGRLFVLVASCVMAGYVLGTWRPSAVPGGPIVPGTPRGVLITVHHGIAERLRSTSRVYVRSPSSVRSLVRELNDLPRLAQPILLCPNDTGSFDEMRFWYQNGDRWTVIVRRSGCLLAFAQADTGPSARATPGLFATVDRLVDVGRRG